MLARSVEVLPSPKVLSGGGQYEPKWDGYRGLVGVGPGGGARIRSRRNRDLTTAFPDIAAAAEQMIPPGSILDGELVVWTGERLDFSQLQRRMVSPANARRLSREWPASFVIFDVLVLGGRDVIDRPLRERRRMLEREVLPGLQPPLQVTPATRDFKTAQTWLADYAVAGVGIEGLVIKGLAEPYRPGRRDWLKLRNRNTVEAVVGAVTASRARPDRLILGLPDPERGLVIAGATGPLKPMQQREVAALLRRPEETHPWPETIPAGRTGAWKAEPLHVLLVEPTLVVEIAADSAYEHGHWRHLTRFVRTRPDLSVVDVEAPVQGAGRASAAGE